MAVSLSLSYLTVTRISSVKPEKERLGRLEHPVSVREGGGGVLGKKN